MAIGERFRGASIVELLRVEVLEGDGTEGSVARVVVYFVDPVTNQVICRVDPMANVAATVAANAGETS